MDRLTHTGATLGVPNLHRSRPVAANPKLERDIHSGLGTLDRTDRAAGCNHKKQSCEDAPPNHSPKDRPAAVGKGRESPG